MRRVFEFADFRLDESERVLRKNGEIVPLPAKVLETLLVLVAQAGEVVEKEVLIERIWPDTFVEENNLNKSVSHLRKLLGGSPDSFIRTIPKRGYLFVHPVALVEREASWPPAPRTISSAEFASFRGRRFATAGLTLAVVALLAWFIRVNPATDANRRATAEPPRLMKVTASGQIKAASISPDGNYLTYVVNDSERCGLWIKHVDTPRGLQLVASEIVSLWGPTFSPDGAFVYFIKEDRRAFTNVLYRVPSLGGDAVPVARNVFCTVSFSPDGRRMAYLRVTGPSDSRAELLVANTDGTGERILATRRPPLFFLRSVSWSPDGSTIACAAGWAACNYGYSSVVGVRVADGSEFPLTENRWDSVDHLEWLRNGTGLVLTARAERSILRQIWHVSVPGGAVRRVTNDLADYFRVSTTNDSSTLVTVQVASSSNLWTVPVAAPDRARQVTFGTGRNGVAGVAWTPRGTVLHTVLTHDAIDIWETDIAGHTERQLTAHAGYNTFPAVSPDGRYIVFRSNRTGENLLWRMNIDGGGLVQLTDGECVGPPMFSPDGRWVYFKTLEAGKPVGRRVPVAGGPPERLSADLTGALALSPDCRRVAFRRVEGPEAPGTIEIKDITGKSLAPPLPSSRAMATVRWTPDGTALAYVDPGQPGWNIFTCPLDGGPSRAVTNFASGETTNFDWTADGRSIVCAREFQTRDVVLLRNFAR